jgi:hypothetical protein
VTGLEHVHILSDHATPALTTTQQPIQKKGNKPTANLTKDICSNHTKELRVTAKERPHFTTVIMQPMPPFYDCFWVGNGTQNNKNGIISSSAYFFKLPKVTQLTKLVANVSFLPLPIEMATLISVLTDMCSSQNTKGPSGIRPPPFTSV